MFRTFGIRSAALLVVTLFLIENTISVGVLPALKRESQKVTILILGDMMLDRNVATRMELYGTDYPFQNMRELFGDNDLTVANLEGVITHNESISRKDREILRFTFNPTLVSTLKKWGFDALSQANNHTADFDREGAEESRRILAENSISVFGDFYNEKDLIAVKKVGGRSIAFIGYNSFAPARKQQVLDLITKTKGKNYLVVVMPHWGEEYETKSNAMQQMLAHEFIDAGADAVIGAHPHVIQDTEVYKGKLIAYSLGNFIFDQDFSEATTEGLAVRITLSGDSLNYDLLPFKILKSQVIPMAEDRKVEIVRSLKSP